jgi:bifunctional DNase/RNase
MSIEAARHGALNLAQGMPDFSPSVHLKKAACEAILAGVNQYAITWGDKLLREAIASKYQWHQGLTVDPETQTPVVVLRALEDTTWFLPIFIGGTEATAIAAHLAGVDLPRPITHDLFARVLDSAGVGVDAMFVTAIHDGTFLAELMMRLPGGETPSFDARPSDAIAIALRMVAPMYVARSVMNEAGGFAPEAIEPGADGDEGDKRPQRRKPGRGQPQALPNADVNLEDLDPRVFGKYKM